MKVVECPYKEDCSDIGELCGSCRHNRKHSYYQQRDYEPYYPITSNYPTVTYYPYPITCTTTYYTPSYFESED